MTISTQRQQIGDAPVATHFLSLPQGQLHNKSNEFTHSYLLCLIDYVFSSKVIFIKCAVDYLTMQWLARSCYAGSLLFYLIAKFYFENEIRKSSSSCCDGCSRCNCVRGWFPLSQRIFFNLPFILLRLRGKKLGGNLHKPAKRCNGASEVPNFALGPLILREGLYLAVGRI